MPLKHFMISLAVFMLKLSICFGIENTSNLTDYNTTSIIETTTIDPFEDVTQQSTADDVFGNVDLRLVYIFNTFFPELNDKEVANLSSDINYWSPRFDGIIKDKWLANCEAATEYYHYLEEMITSETDNGTFVTYDRLNSVIGCLEDCDFTSLLSVPSNFTLFNDDTKYFADNAVLNLPADAAFYCQYSFDTFAAFEEPNASFLLDNINYINLVDPEAFESFSEEDSLALAIKLSSSGKRLTDAQLESLAANIADDVPLDNISSLANALPLGCFDNTSPSKLVGLLNQFDLENMDESRKIYIGSLIANSGDAALITKFLNSTTDSSILDAIPGYLFDDLIIDISSIPSDNVPDSYLKSFSEKQLKTKCISTVTDISSISRMLPGITSDELVCVEDNVKVATIVNILKASINYNVDLTSIQRASMLNSLLISLSNNSNSTNATIYLRGLNTTQCEVLFPLFIEANSTILSALNNLATFDTLISKVSTIPATKCCSYSPASLQLFASYAVLSKFSYKKLSPADLDKLGPCLYSHLPLENLQSLDPGVFIKKYSILGSSFQPTETEIQVVKSKISDYANNATLVKSQDNLVFSTLMDLSIFYPFDSFTSNLTSWQTGGGNLLKKFSDTRDPTTSSNDLCQLGLNQTDIQVYTNLIEGYKTTLVNQFFGSAKKRVAINYTCDQLKKMGTGATAINASQLLLIQKAEYNKCESTLGAITKWSTAQLASLASLAKTSYGTIDSISDKNIGSLNSIVQGFSETDLTSLNFTTATSINALGSLNKWTSAQLNALSTPLASYIQKYLKNNATSKFLSSAGNLLCAFPTSQITTTIIPTSQFQLSVGAPSKISVTCPNIANWYSYARSLTRYSSKRAATALSRSSLTELGSVIAGITISDLQLLQRSSMSSISASAFQFMPADTVNELTADQLNGLAATQITALQNSPYYASFSTSIKSGLTSLALNSAVSTLTSKTTSGTKQLNFNLIQIAICLISSFVF